MDWISYVNNQPGSTAHDQDTEGRINAFGSESEEVVRWLEPIFTLEQVRHCTDGCPNEGSVLKRDTLFVSKNQGFGF